MQFHSTQQHRSRVWHALLLIAALLLPLLLQPTPTRAAGVIYVKADAAGANNGTSWTDAYPKLQDALANATAGDEIWVAKGVYYPDEGAGQTNNARTSTFTLKTGVALYGGFAGTESQRTQRNPAANVTVLSGDLDKNDPNKDATGVVTNPSGLTGNNAYRVVTNSNVDATAVLDGFSITAGLANDIAPDNSGGGMYNISSSPTLTNVTFSANSASSQGGGMFNSTSSPTLTNVTFSANSAFSQGGGMFNASSSPTLTNVTFSANSAIQGGGMYNSSSSPTLTNVTFSANSATNVGGGMYNNNPSSPTLTNVIIANSTNGGDCVGPLNGASSNNLIEDSTNACGLTNGNGTIIGQDPQLGPLQNNGGATLTHALLAGSPAIDAVTNAGCPATDQRSAPRPQGPACDIGSFELITRLYVKADATGANNGTSWTDAYSKLQNALALATAASDIWVAKGVYYPDEGAGQTNNARTSTFTLKTGVALYGGFAGTESQRTQRDTVANVTVLSGDLDGNDPNTDANGVVTNPSGLTGNNAYHVVKGSNVDATAVLDGFSITGGLANGASPNDSGGGMYNTSSSPTLTDVTFSANSASQGGGMYNTSSSPTLTDVTFSANSASQGGGMFNSTSSPTLTNVTFSANSATNVGGGMANTNTSSPTLTNVTFSANSATSLGGGMYNNNASSPTLTNVTFSANSAANLGGGMFNTTTSSPTLTNVTFSANSATNVGGGMINTNNSSPTLTNVIIANSTNGGDCVGPLNGASSNNLIEDSTNACGLTNGNGTIIGQDPQLGPLQNNGGATLTHALLAGSPAIDKGTNTGCPATDQRGAPRPQGPACDIGAVEALPDTTPPSVAVEQAQSQTDPTATGPITFSVTFSEPVTGFDSTDVTLGGTAGATTATVSGSGASYTISVSGMTQSGTVTATIKAGAAQDAAGNLNTASTSTDNEVTYDITSPSVTVEQAQGQADPTATGPILFSVTFSKPVTGFDNTDVTLGGTAGATTATVTGSGNSYTISVSGMTQSGTVTASVKVGAAQDATGNLNTASTSSDNTVTYTPASPPDTTPPSVTVEQAQGQADPTATGPILFSVTFSKPVTGFDSTDVTLGGTAGATTATVTGSGANYTISVSGMTQSGTVTASVKAGAAQDAAGNTNTASISSDNQVTYNSTSTTSSPPYLTINHSVGAPGSAFVITGFNFPVHSALHILVNGVSIDGITSDGEGRVAFVLNTLPSHTEGFYVVVVTNAGNPGSIAQNQTAPSLAMTNYHLVTSGPDAIVHTAPPDAPTSQVSVPTSVRPHTILPQLFIPVVIGH